MNRSLLNAAVLLYTIPPDTPYRNRLRICIRAFFGLCYSLFLPSAPVFSALPSPRGESVFSVITLRHSLSFLAWFGFVTR
ncbi:Uncharacterized protein TCM_009061 [Theobroma cacao]|uniref:Uncharacterized protein n=1 Tax=Theobroma cacao TaxID=3641 RepID=A0A061E6H1_THECC|nr:Uncharacterized protein TCM_009061 [Theobroma cacao]